MRLPSASVAEKVICTHCGDDCGQEKILFMQKPFCCEGCRTVYELFTEHGLDQYYALNKNPGSSRKQASSERFGFLDQQDISDKLISYRDDENVRITLEIPSIHCSSCIWLLENLHALNSGVRFSSVNFNKKELTLLLNPQKISLRNSAQLLADIGYEPVIRMDKITGKESKRPKDYSRWYKIGVAGFCFGNIMLLSLPEYFDPSLAADRSYSIFFRIMNVLISLPAVFYVSPEYFRSAWASVKVKKLNIDVPIALGILVIFLRSIFEMVTDTGSGYLDSLCGLVFFMSVGRTFQQITYSGLNFERDYKSYFPVSAELADEKEERYVPVTDLKPGQIIRLRNGELCPADATLLSEIGQFDSAFVTGESKPVAKKKGDTVFAGLKNMGQASVLRIEKEVSRSYLTDLWNNKSFQKAESRIQGITDRLSKYFTPVIMLIALVAFGIHGYSGHWATAWNALTAVLIVACPCALALAAPFTFGNALRILGRNRFYLKNALSLETLAAVNHIVFDKTGTITLAGEDDIAYEGRILSEEEKTALASLLHQSVHPLSKSLYKQLGIRGDDRVHEFCEREGKGLEALINGEVWKAGSSAWLQVQVPESFHGQTSVWISRGGKVLGGFRFRNRYRQGLRQTLGQFGSEMKFSVLSGDHSGEESRLKEYFPAGTEMVFNALPQEKPVYLQTLKDKGRLVMMAGDGLNDSGALKTADLGVSVSDNLNHFTPASDAILDGKVFDKLPLFIRFAGQSKNVVKAGFTISLLYNVFGLYLAVIGHLTPVFAAIIMPVSSITVVSFVTLSVNYLAHKMKL
jgi:Cu+-exporting ATPase